MAAEKSRRKRFAELEERLTKDYDPEADAPAVDSDNSESEGGSDELDGTEHYISVGKSKLRVTDPVSLGPQYRGKRVSRAAIDESEDEEDGEDNEERSASEDDDSESEGFDDPEIADLEADHVDDDEEIDSDEAFCESDEEKFGKFTFRGSSKPRTLKRKKRPTAADFISDSEEEGEEEALNGRQPGASLLENPDVSDKDENDEDEEEEEGSENVSGSDEDVSSGSDDDIEEDSDGASEDDKDEDEDEDEDDEDDDDRAVLRKIMNGGGQKDNADTREASRKVLSEGQKAVAATLTKAVKTDIEKGRAVRQQRKSFDTLLNVRIRLQKALVAVNSLPVVPESGQEAAGPEPYQAAEEAALKLWSSIETFRHSMAPSSAKGSPPAAGQKRKRGQPPGPETPLEELWEDMGAIEARALTHRRRVLESWADKIRAKTEVGATRRRQLGAGGSSSSQSLTSVLDDQLLNMDRLVGRTRIPRSCAPLQAAGKAAGQEDEGIYDDADFYQLLLKELVDQRTLDPSSSSSSGAAVPTVRWGASVREAKTRKQVDRRASKGRKLRFTAHEKLQNFMAPEDRRAWEQDAIDRLFGTLFGQKMELGAGGEDDGVDVGDGEVRDGGSGGDDDEAGGVSLEDQGLRLFRS